MPATKAIYVRLTTHIDNVTSTHVFHMYMVHACMTTREKELKSIIIDKGKKVALYYIESNFTYNKIKEKKTQAGESGIFL